MKINSYFKAESVEQAYKVLEENRDAAIIAGGAWLKLMPKTIGTAVDLTGLGLDEIWETETEYEIGCMTTLRQVEKFEPFKTMFGGILSESASNIMGVTVRNIATIGGTAAGKYGFSDLLPVLLALDSDLKLYKGGRVKFSDYLKETGFSQDILTHVCIKKSKDCGWFYTMKNTAIDFPILNCAITVGDRGVKICIGARPYKAALAEKAMDYINSCDNPGKEQFKKAADIAADELKFGKNQRGSAEYRKELCRSFVFRGLTEVMS